jgi:hypothetical protein
MSDYCTWSPEGLFGVEWSMSCMSHDGQYSTGKTLADKIIADLALSQDIWALSVLADAPWKQGAIRIYSVGVFAATSTVGFFFWFRAKLKFRDILLSLKIPSNS